MKLAAVLVSIALATSATATYWFSFGDSYTTTGFVPNGTQPAPGNPLGNPPFPGATNVGGTNWIDEMTVKYSSSLVLTYNYAFGGATIDAALVDPGPGIATLADQVDAFVGGAGARPPGANWTGDDALFSVWIGINDVGRSYANSGSRDSFSDALLWAYFNLVEKLINAGARNFLFINVPPVDRSPLMMAAGAAAQAQEAAVIAGYNAKLAQRVQWLLGNNTAVNAWQWDAHTAFTAILDDPKAYGFVDNTSWGQPGDFWGNNYHPSSAVHELLAQDVAKVLNNTVW